MCLTVRDLGRIEEGAKTKVVCFGENNTEPKATITKHMAWVRVPMKVVSVVVIAVDNTVTQRFLGFRIIFLE